MIERFDGKWLIATEASMGVIHCTLGKKDTYARIEKYISNYGNVEEHFHIRFNYLRFNYMS